MTERGRKFKRIKLAPDVKKEYERVGCIKESDDEITIKDEPVDFALEADSHNADRIDAILDRQKAEENYEITTTDESVDFALEADWRMSNERSIDAILERKRAEEELSSIMIENLRNLIIKLGHKVPPQHQIERMAGSHAPSAEEKEAFAQLVPKKQIKKGTFTYEEDQLIIKNWKTFCETHHWDKHNPKPFLFMRQHNGTFYLKKESERKKFVQFLANGLPTRTLYSVYHRFRILYDTPRMRAKYTFEEDKHIVNHIEHNENVNKACMFSDLAKALNRSRASVWRRYRLLKRKRAAALYEGDC